MEQYVIKGGNPLVGEVEIGGAKNAALAILSACLLYTSKISNVQTGLVTEGVVESLQPYGAFVDLGNGLSGLVHISQICEKRIKKPSEVLTVGDKVKVKVIAVKDGKLSLSIKEASDMMAKEIEEEVYEIPDSGEEATTTLGALFAGIKLD